MSPVGKFLLDRMDSSFRVRGRDIQEAAFRFAKEGTCFTRYMLINEYVAKLGLEVSQPTY